MTARGMFSSRTHWNFTRNRLALALDRAAAQGRAMLDLTEGNPTRALPAVLPTDAVLASLAADPVRRYEPDPRGLAVARAAVAEYYASRELAVDPARVVLSASTSEAYGWLFKLLCDPGDEVLIPQPSYPLFDDLARLESVHTVPYSLTYDGAWRLDLHSLRAALTPRSRAVLVVHPNNPTGSFLKRDELDGLRALCRAHGLALVSDEVFGDYAHGPDPARVPSLATVADVLTFTLGGLSKVVALPQMKLGWLVVGGPADEVSEALARLEHVADCYLSVGAPVQHAARAFLGTRRFVQAAIRARVAANREALAQALAGESRASVLAAEGGWYATLRVPRTRTEEDWVVELVARDGVLVQPGYFFDFATEAYLVVSLLGPEAAFREGLARVLARVEAE